MATVQGLQHIFSSVERGYRSTQNRGFQTVAAAEELFGTPDLEALERAALYSVNRERRDAEQFPTKETFFCLPSGRFAIGRTVPWAPDSTGREGNYLTRHLIITETEFANADNNPFAILDSEEFAKSDIDLTPRALPPLGVDVPSLKPDFTGFEKLRPAFLAGLAISAVDGGEKTVLLIGNEARSREILRGLICALPLKERPKLTFCTHFYESGHLQSQFAAATVRSRPEAPPGQQAYAVFDLENGEFPGIPSRSAYSVWLSECLKGGHVNEVPGLISVLNDLRAKKGDLAGLATFAPGKAYAALWERADVEMPRALIGKAPLITSVLEPLPPRHPLADALLAAGSPSVVCGTKSAEALVDACLSELRSKATRKAWVMWLRKWKKEPEIVAFLKKTKKPWWKRWKK